MVANVWSMTPFFFLLLSAALAGIPNEVIESARVDRARGWSLVWQIKLPFLRNALLVGSLLMIITNFNDFAKIWATTQGGPGYATTTLVVYVYRLAFENFDFGYASAMGVVWLVLLMVFALAYLRALRMQDPDDRPPSAASRVRKRPRRHEAARIVARLRRLALAWSLAPVYWMLATSFKTEIEAARLDPTLMAARRRRSTTTRGLAGGTLPFATFFANTAVTCLATALVAVLIAHARGLRAVARAVPAARVRRLRHPGVSHAAAGRAARAALPAASACAPARYDRGP